MGILLRPVKTRYFGACLNRMVEDEFLWWLCQLLEWMGCESNQLGAG